MIKKRKKLLKSLLEMNGAISVICAQLSEFGWDCEEDLITFKSNNALSVLNQYLKHQITKDDLEEWANAIEGREDISFEKDYLKKLIYDLANPILTEPITNHTAKRWIMKIENS